MGTAEAVVYPRLHFGDGGILDWPEPVGDVGREEFEARWRAVSVRVSWMRTPHGRLDHALDADVIVIRGVDNSDD